MIEDESAWRSVIHGLVEPYRRYGTSFAKNGAERIAPALGVAPLAFVHLLYPSLESKAIDLCRDWAGHRQGGCADLGEIEGLWRVCGGLSLFCGHLTIYGKQPSLLSRDVNNPIAFDFIGENRRHDWVRPPLVVIGSWDDAHLLSLDCNSSVIRLHDRETGEEQSEWSTLRDAVGSLGDILAKRKDWTQHVPSWRK